MASINDIKLMTLRAMMADELLMKGLVLKGGNALQLAYDITSRGSIDIDFSMENEFSETDFKRLSNTFKELLNDEFVTESLVAFDVKFIKKPKSGSIPEWRGYQLDFKLIEKSKFDEFGGDTEAIRRNAIKVNGQSTRYTVDISSYEYIAGAKSKEVGGVILSVYTPEMILMEKLRALCQSMPEYKSIVDTARQKDRARDIYDIWKICDSFTSLDLTKELLENIFKAKRVPITFLDALEQLREPFRENWEIVKQTITNDEDLESYDYYFDFLIDLVKKITSLLDNTVASDLKTP